jgi:hypothetical protein
MEMDNKRPAPKSVKLLPKAKQTRIISNSNSIITGNFISEPHLELPKHDSP